MKIFCIGRNYAEHAKELKNDVPTEPVVFMKPQTALLTGNKPFYHPDFTSNLHFECEVVLRICKTGKQIQQKFAHKYYDAFTLGIDFTARDLQDKQKAKGLPWEIAKAFDSSAVIGDWIKIADENKAQPIEFEFYLNNNLAQKGSTKDLIFSFETIIAYISQYFTLQTGDIIFTGTPSGVGAINIGDGLIGKYNGTEIFNFEIK